MALPRVLPFHHQRNNANQYSRSTLEGHVVVEPRLPYRHLHARLVRKTASFLAQQTWLVPVPLATSSDVSCRVPSPLWPFLVTLDEGCWYLWGESQISVRWSILVITSRNWSVLTFNHPGYLIFNFDSCRTWGLAISCFSDARSVWLHRLWSFALTNNSTSWKETFASS